MKRSEVLALDGFELSDAAAVAIGRTCAFAPHRSADHDYHVLEHVRTLGNEMICKVRDIAGSYVWSSRAELHPNRWRMVDGPVWGCTQYLPGDWALSYLLALCDDPPEPGCVDLVGPMIQRT